MLRRISSGVAAHATSGSPHWARWLSTTTTTRLTGHGDSNPSTRGSSPCQGLPGASAAAHLPGPPTAEEQRHPCTRIRPQAALLGSRAVATARASWRCSLGPTAPAGARFASTSTSMPPLPSGDFEGHIIESVAKIGDLKAVGLAVNYTPVGWIQQVVEASSATLGLTWGGGIVVTTIALRTLLLPVIVRNMRNAVLLGNAQPEIQMHTDRMNACTATGDTEGAAEAQQNLTAVFKRIGAHPLAALKPLLFQMPIMVSFFFALRRMAELPVVGLENAGALWFTDLTAPDPYLILPAVTCVTMLATIELGADGMKAHPQMIWVMRAMSVVIFPVTMSFPSALFLYWVTSNMFSLGQVAVLKHPAIRSALNIPVQTHFPKPVSKDGPGFMDSFRNAMKVQQEAARRKEVEASIEQRQRARKAAVKTTKRRRGRQQPK